MGQHTVGAFQIPHAQLLMHTTSPLQLCTRGQPSLLRAIVGAYGRPYFQLGVLKVSDLPMAKQQVVDVQQI